MMTGDEDVLAGVATIEILPKAGHAPWLDDLDTCVAVVGRFLRGKSN